MKICKSKVKEIIGLVFLFAGLVLMFSCCDMFGIEEETESKYDITFINNSSYDLTISDSYGNNFEEFTISSGETKIIKSNSKYIIMLDISTDTKVSDVDYDKSDQTITLYDGDDIYDITFINNSSYDLIISDSYGEDFEDFSISTGETKVIKSNSKYIIFDITTDTEDADIDYDKSDQTVTLSDGEDSEDTTPNPWEGYDSYLSSDNYDSLISSLSSSYNIDRDMIDSFLDELKVKQNYDYSYYSSDNYICHTLTWSSYSSYSYGWIYYVSVDIWVDNAGNLRKTMCSYYSG